MIFSSPVFLFAFCPVFFIVLFCIPCTAVRAKNVWIIIGSLLFYAWGAGTFIVVVLGTLVLDYFFGRGIAQKGKYCKLFVTADVVMNLGILLYFKYFNFFLENLNAVFSRMGIEAISFASVALPYSFQIFFDFSAYSDMAIGMLAIMGFHIGENFDQPYTALSVTDFWKRWHISMTSWFREYLYIPLGGNRKGRARTYLNLWIVFLLSGFWHGAAWNFIFWGAYHGLLLCIERGGLLKRLERVPAGIRVAGTFFLRAVACQGVNPHAAARLQACTEPT